MTEKPQKIFLAGFMGTGKSAIGQKLAKNLGYQFLDTDTLIQKTAKKSIPEIFARQGEKSFRALEAKVIDQVCGREKVVVSLGGGAVCHQANLNKLRRSGVLILLRASEATLFKRLRGDQTRPLLQGGAKGKDLLTVLRSLLERREKYYGQIPWQVATDGKSPLALARQIQRVYPLERDALWVRLGERSYPLYFGHDSQKLLPDLLSQHFNTSKVVVVTNTTLDRPYGIPLVRGLKKDFRVVKVVLPDGERYKNLKTVQKLYGALLKNKVDRRTPLVALGGGVLGDLVGFAAASYLRGIPFVQIPTTLLAQVDSSIGGKTGVDLPEGKNLVGAFYQPKFVLMDETFLKTLPPRQLIGGMAEVIKYAAIFDAKLFRDLENHLETYLEKPEESMEAVLRRCCEWKGWVVETDERETKDIRSKLNFGHTLGHAIESLTHYRKYTHGEAIAMGMVFAAQASQGKTGLSERSVERLRGLLERAGLPRQWPRFSKTQYMKALTQDKKRVSSWLNFVYLEKIGKSIVLPTPMEEVKQWL
ncbi:MAG: 3-dehydroquinate synthase [bacterium]|nr:3-dehydroquinate synthase [bacterium]